MICTCFVNAAPRGAAPEISTLRDVKSYCSTARVGGCQRKTPREDVRRTRMSGEDDHYRRDNQCEFDSIPFDVGAELYRIEAWLDNARAAGFDGEQ